MAALAVLVAASGVEMAVAAADVVAVTVVAGHIRPEVLG